MKKCYVFDIDGTLADASHRLHHIKGEKKDWDAFFDSCDQDSPILHICELAEDLECHADLVLCTGRPERLREKTEEWLEENTRLAWSGLFMRADNDHRPDHIVKRELLDAMRKAGWEPIMAFEDRTQVVDMWRKSGIPCAQVAPGEF